jgi:hypothetical protein
MGEKRNPCTLRVGNTKGKRPLGRPRRRLVDDIKMDLLQIGLGELAQDRYRLRALVNAVIFGFHKMLGNYRVATQLVASRVALSYTELVL